MRIYRWAWMLSCTALAVTGLAAGSAVSPAALVSVVIVAAIIGAVVSFALWCATEPEPGCSRAAFVLRGAALALLVPSAALGLAVALGGNLVLVALLMVLSAPPLVGRYHRWLDSAPRPSAGPAGPTAQLSRLTEEELCDRWRISCAQLPAQSSTSTRRGVVEERRELLDEIERRNPAGFLAWITSEPRPATLRAHLSETPGSRAQVDWSTLLS